MLQGLQVNVTQELNLHTKNISNELVKVTKKNVGLHLYYNRVTIERDEDVQKA
jgi:hypothetical protein